MATTIKNKPWAGRFTSATNTLAEELNASIGFDCRLYKYDIMGSVAHAKTLKRAGILTAAESAKIVKGLKAVEKEIEAGRFEFLVEDEDIHMAIEKRLTQKIGAVGGKLHTGRSRNDQVALDVRLYLKAECEETLTLLKQLRKTLVSLAKRHVDTIMPGYTHLQRAQPVLLAHHLMAYYEMFARDEGRFVDCMARVDVMPLGAGALAGSPYALDRDYTAKLLGFSKVTANSLDAVSDRDFSIEFISASSIMMMHLSRFAEELIIWSSQEFGFIEFSDSFSTGSSIMPQKKNPDMAELARGKVGRVYGNLMTLLTVMKALPLAYNKDMQEDKEPLFDTIDTIKAVLGVVAPMVKTMRVNKKNMRRATVEGFLTATDVADYLVGKGLAFRKAHAVSGKAVRFAIDNSKTLEELTMKEWKRFSPFFEDGIFSAVTVESSIKARKISGGTGTASVMAQIKRAERELKKRGRAL